MPAETPTNPISLALTSLLPTHSTLPPQLFTLSTSLLSQSRMKAAHLRPDEEIARTYAVCHIACDRLRKKLDLEVGKANPPVTKRVYERLWGYLDGVLTMPVNAGGKERARGPRTTPAERKLRNSDGAGVSSGKVETPKTPSATVGSKRGRERDDEREEEETPAFVMPMIRAVCKANDTPAMAPHVLVGATTVKREMLSRRDGGHEDVDSPSSKRIRRGRTMQSSTPARNQVNRSQPFTTAQWPSLIVAIYLLVAARTQGFGIDDSSTIDDLQEESVTAIHKFCTDPKTKNLSEDIHSSLNDLKTSVSAHLLTARHQSWDEMEWYQNIPIDSDAIHENDGEDVPNSEDSDPDLVTPRRKRTRQFHKTPLQRKEKHAAAGPTMQDDNVLGSAGLLPGYATMFQPAVDWLSEERREEYKFWRDGILREVRQIEGRA